MIIALFALAAAAGTTVRWRVWAHAPVGAAGTLIVNLVGSFLLGLLAGAGPDQQVVIGTAGLGALTTFSTFVYELLDLLEHSPRMAWAYGAASVIGGVAAAWVGLTLA